MNLADALRDEPSALFCFYAEQAPQIVRASLMELDGFPDTKNSRSYIGTAALLDVEKGDDYDWIAEEVALIDFSPDDYDNYIAFLYHMPLTSVMITLAWLQNSFPARYEHLMTEIHSGSNPKTVQLEQRIQRAQQHLALSEVVDPATLNSLKEAMA